RVALLRLRPIARVIELAEEPGMHDRDVVALEVVVDVDLPVAIELPRFAMREAEAGVVVARHVGEELAEEIGQRLGVRIEIDEYELVPHLDAELRQDA